MAYTYAGRDKKGKMVFYTTTPEDEEILKKRFGKNIVVEQSIEKYAEYTTAPIRPITPQPTPPPPPPPTEITPIKTPTLPEIVQPKPLEKETPWGKILIYGGIGLAGIIALLVLFRRKK